MLYLSKENIKIHRASHNYLVGEMKQMDERFTYIKRGELVGWFDGVQTFLDYLLEHMKTPKESEDSSSKRGGGSFYSFESYEDAIDTFRNRPDKVLKYLEIDEDLKDWEETGLDVEYDMTGDFLDIGRYMHGVPEVFGSMKNGNPRRYRANVTIDLSWYAGIEKNTINERLKHVVATCDWLEMNGIRTSITAIESTGVAHVEILVKDFDEVLDLRQLAVVSHGDFLRRAMFRFDEYSSTWDYGYGSPRVFHDALDSINKPEPSMVEMDILVGSRSSEHEEYKDNFKRLREEITECLREGELKPLTVLG